jgi:hypothetical protein
MKFVSTVSPVSLTSDPVNGTDGELYFNSSSGVYRYFTSSSWVSLIDTKSHVTNIVSNIFNIGSTASAYISHTLANNEIGGTLVMVSASSALIVIPDSDSSTFHVGSSFYVMRGAQGTVGVIGDGGTSILKPSPHYLTAVYSYIKLLKIDEDLWLMTGEFPDIY